MLVWSEIFGLQAKHVQLDNNVKRQNFDGYTKKNVVNFLVRLFLCIHNAYTTKTKKQNLHSENFLRSLHLSFHSHFPHCKQKHQNF